MLQFVLQVQHQGHCYNKSEGAAQPDAINQLLSMTVIDVEMHTFGKAI